MIAIIPSLTFQPAVAGDQPFRAVLAVVVLIVFSIAASYRIRSQRSLEKLDRRQEGWFILMTLRPIGALAVLSLMAWLLNPGWMRWSWLPLPPWMRWIGLAMTALGGALLIWTMHTLGLNLTDTVVTRQRHTLVVSGPYQFVRHPFYDAVVLLVIGAALATANWFIFVTGVTVFALQVLRSRTEEENLAKRFGDAYLEYRRRTGRLIPRVGVVR